MSIFRTHREQTTRNTALELLDCGRASKVTKGYPRFFLIELGWPPFDGLVL